MRALPSPLGKTALALLSSVLFALGCRSRASSNQSIDPAPESATAPTPLAVPPTGSPFAYSVSVTDPAGALTSEHAALKKCVETGLDLWGKYLTGKGTITVEIIVTNTATAGRLTAASGSAHYVGKCKSMAPCELAEDQSIHRLRTGEDNPLAPGIADIRVYVTPDFWRKYLWMDPDPVARRLSVPDDRDDAISICTHELGHGFGMAGYRDVGTYAPKPLKGVGTVLSPYDDLVSLSPTPTFVGPKTVAEFGPVPLTHEHSTEDLYHYGNGATPTAYDGRLMNGVSFVMGRRYAISRVDVLILQDLGVPIRALP